MRDVGGSGFVGLNDYIGANQGVLDAGYTQDSAQAHQVGDTLQGYINEIEPSALQQSAHGTPGDRAGINGYTSATAMAGTAGDLGRKLGSEGGLAGSGANPVSGEQGFNAALSYGAHGGDYHTLGQWLQGLAVAPEDAYQRGTQTGLEIASRPASSGTAGGRHNKPSGELPSSDPLPLPPDPNDVPPGSTDNSIYGGGGG